jgi:hypothetical protein
MLFFELQGRQIPAEYVLENPTLVCLAMKARNGDLESGQIAATIELVIDGAQGESWFNYQVDIPPVV